MAMTTTLFIPTLNEVNGMKATMPQIKRDWVDQILIVDGNSTDGTIEYARAQGYDVYVQKRKGIRNAYIEAWPLIKGDIVITFSPDGNSVPEVIPLLVAKMKEGYDMVIASRYGQGAHSDDDDWLTGFGNWMFTGLINLLHRGHFTDAMGIYRAYRTNLFYELAMDKLESYAPDKLMGTVSGLEPLLSIRALKRKIRIAEVPGDEPSRIGGVRKMQPFRWGTVFLMQIFRELYFWR